MEPAEDDEAASQARLTVVSRYPWLLRAAVTVATNLYRRLNQRQIHNVHAILDASLPVDVDARVAAIRTTGDTLAAIAPPYRALADDVAARREQP